MSLFRYFLLCAIGWNIQVFALNGMDLCHAIDRGDSSAVLAFFNQIERIDSTKAQELISEIYGYYVNQFGPEILNSEEYLSSLEYCKEIYHSILNEKGISSRYSLIKNNHTCQVLTCHNNKNKEGEEELPGSLILGGVEILGGALVWILPFSGTKQLGSIMIADGFRRAFNGAEEQSAKNKQNQNGQNI